MTDGAFRRLLLLAAVAGAVHALLYLPVVAHVANDSSTYVAAAEALLDGSYSTPLRAARLYETDEVFADLTGYEISREVWNEREKQTYRTPGYPAFLAVFGGGVDGTSQVLALVAQCVLLGLASLFLGLAFRPLVGERIALLGAWLYALDPFSRRFASLLLTEALASFLVAVTAYLLVRVWRSDAAAPWALLGAVAAALTLVRPVYSLAVALLFVAALVLRAPPRVRLARVGAFGAAVAVLIVPWLVWNATATGEVTLATSSRGLALMYAAHGEGPSRSYEEIFNDRDFIREFYSVHDWAPTHDELRHDREAHPRYAVRAEKEYSRLAWARYGDRLRSEPLVVAAEVAYRGVVLFRSGWSEVEARLGRLVVAYDALILLLAAAGAVILVRIGGPARAIVLFVLAFAASSALLHAEGRYGMPLRGLVLMFVAAAIAPLVRPVAARFAT